MIEDLSKNILDKIKQQDIKPKSRFSFLAKNYAFWISALISVVVGACTFATILFVILNQDLLFFKQAQGNIITFIAFALPYFWFVIFSIFIAVAYINIKHIEGAYKLRLPTIIGLYFIATILCGSVLYRVGVGEYAEHVFANRVPLYGRVVEHRQKMWHRPENGLLMGRVLDVDEDTNIILLDVAEHEWDVDITNAKYPPYLMIKKEMMLRILGEAVEDEYLFYAHEIRPYMLPMRMKKSF